MSSRTPDACLLAVGLFLVSCTRPPEADLGRAQADAPATDAPALVLDEPAADVPPAVAPGAAAALAARAELAAAAPAPFGVDAQALARAWGAPLEASPADSPAACHYLFAQPRPALGYGKAFMIEDGRFVRMDVDDPAATAPGGGRIGMTASAIAALYPGRVEERPHKYVEGARYLRVTGGDGAGDAVLVFETGPQGVVEEWRVGVPPQVDYVEGCS